MKIASCFLSTALLIASNSFATEGSTLQPARIDDGSLKCVIGDSNMRQNNTYEATLEVKGFSLAPAVRNETTNDWEEIKNEPLFVFPPSSGSSAENGQVHISVFHKYYSTSVLGTSRITNAIIGAQAVGTLRDMPFSATYKLRFIGEAKALSREIKVNGYLACKIEFSPQTLTWTVSPVLQ